MVGLVLSNLADGVVEGWEPYTFKSITAGAQSEPCKRSKCPTAGLSSPTCCHASVVCCQELCCSLWHWSLYTSDPCCLPGCLLLLSCLAAAAAVCSLACACLSPLLPCPAACRAVLCRRLTRRSATWTPWVRTVTRTAPSSCSCCATTSPCGPARCRTRTRARHLRHKQQGSAVQHLRQRLCGASRCGNVSSGAVMASAVAAALGRTVGPGLCWAQQQRRVGSAAAGFQAASSSGLWRVRACMHVPGVLLVQMHKVYCTTA